MLKNEEEQKNFHKKYLKSKEFGIVREMVFSRDRNRCVVCGRKEKLTCHHTSYKHLGEHNRNEIDDCITLCQICHVAHHRQPISKQWYSIEHPRNRNDLKTVEYGGREYLVDDELTEIYDAQTYRKIPIKKLKRNDGKPSITVDGKDIIL